MSVNSVVKAVRLSGFDAAGLTGGYDAINVGGLSEACFLIRIINNTKIGVGISYDGVTTHDYILSEQVLDLNFQTNSQPSGRVALMAKGTTVYVIAPNPSVGFIWLAAYFQV
jgi:hypothetical protein